VIHSIGEQPGAVERRLTSIEVDVASVKEKQSEQERVAGEWRAGFDKERTGIIRWVIVSLLTALVSAGGVILRLLGGD
jgi:hypothetical protein